MYHDGLNNNTFFPLWLFYLTHPGSLLKCQFYFVAIQISSVSLHQWMNCWSIKANSCTVHKVPPRYRYYRIFLKMDWNKIFYRLYRYNIYRKDNSILDIYIIVPDVVSYFFGAMMAEAPPQIDQFPCLGYLCWAGLTYIDEWHIARTDLVLKYDI